MRWTGDDAMADDADVIVVGGGLAGLVAATEMADAGKRVIVVDQEGEQSLGGQAFWSFGGLFLVDTPRRTAGTYLPLPHPTHQQYSVNG